MAGQSERVEWPGLDGDPTEGMSTPFRHLMTQLLLYKSVFSGEWFERVGADGPHDDEFSAIREETVREAKETVEVVHLWSRFPRAPESAETAAANAHVRLLENLVNLKEGSTEAFLAVAMCAPTQELRQEFTRLADLDHKHADTLRQVLGAREPRPTLADAIGTETPTGAHAGRARGGSLRANIEECADRLRARGNVPARIVVSAAALRHLRDEDAVDMERGLVCGLPAEVDLGWIGECYAFATRERVTLAEIVTEAHTPAHSDRRIDE